MRLLEKLRGQGKSKNQASLVELVKSLSDYQKRPVEERYGVVAYQYRDGRMLRDESGQRRIDQKRRVAEQNVQNSREMLIELARHNSKDVTRQLFLMIADPTTAELSGMADSLLSDLAREVGSEIVDGVLACILEGHVIENRYFTSLLLFVVVEQSQTRVGPLPPASKEALMVALSDARADVRFCAASALRLVSGAEVIARLKEVSQSDLDSEVASKARESAECSRSSP
jgi:hypothetical protein